MFEGGFVDLFMMVEVYVALCLVGDDADALYLWVVWVFIFCGGGLEVICVFIWFWFALFGEWLWDELFVMLLELLYLLKWVLFNIYDWGCWVC